MAQNYSFYNSTAFKIISFGLLLGTVLLLILGPKLPSQNDRQIIIGEAEIAGLLNSWEKTWQRPPTREEFKDLLDGFITNEMLFQEAINQGMDKNNAMVKNALILQMNMLASSQAGVDELSETQIEAYYNLRKDQYLSEDRISFTQLFFGQDENSLQTTLNQLTESSINPSQELPNSGINTMLPKRTVETECSIIDRNFGDGFSAKLLELPVGEWVGPVNSSFGLHLIFIEKVWGKEPIPLDEVRNIILREMEYDSKEAAKNQFFSELRNQYKIIYRGDAKKFVEDN